MFQIPKNLMFQYRFSELSANRDRSFSFPTPLVQESNEVSTNIDYSDHYQKITKCVCAHTINDFPVYFKESKNPEIIQMRSFECNYIV